MRDDDDVPPLAGSPPRPLLPYGDRRTPPPPAEPTPAEAAVQFAGALLAYVSLVLAMKLAALRFGWEIGAVCGVWVVVLAVSFAVCGWMAAALGWRAAMAGLIVGLVLTLLASGLILSRA